MRFLSSKEEASCKVPTFFLFRKKNIHQAPSGVGGLFSVQWDLEMDRDWAVIL
jgi:hypothetical protein